MPVPLPEPFNTAQLLIVVTHPLSVAMPPTAEFKPIIASLTVVVPSTVSRPHRSNVEPADNAIWLAPPSTNWVPGAAGLHPPGKGAAGSRPIIQLSSGRKRRGGARLFVIGVDLIKDKDVLFRAYNDAEGVTAKFNFNLLVRINRELKANFNLSAFEHHAFYNSEQHRIEMHLASLRRQKVKVNGTTIDFLAGETIHTENSYKYTVESFQALARGSGWKPVKVWSDGLFSVHALSFDGTQKDS